MPIYIYRCPVCQVSEKVTAKMSDPKPEHCDVKMERVPAKTGFTLQGSGWYKDGYK